MFPSVITSFPKVNPTDRLNNPSHSALENLQSSTIGQIEALIGLEGNSSTLGTLIYDVRSPNSNGGGHVQTANKGGTGQVTYNKGDLLVAQSSSVLTKVASNGVNGNALIQDDTQATGVRWGIPNNFPVVRTYTSSVAQIWIKPSNLSYVVVQVQAGGGAGGNELSISAQAAGGGSGAYTMKIIPVSSLPSAASVFAGGASVLSYFGSILSCTGGKNATTTTQGAGGSVLLAGDISVNGVSGQNMTGSSTTSYGGIGGGAILGIAGMGRSAAGNNGFDSSGYGAGGGGANSTGASDTFGGAGGGGIIVVYEY